MAQNERTICPICDGKYNAEERFLESGVVIRDSCLRCGTFDFDKDLIAK